MHTYIQTNIHTMIQCRGKGQLQMVKVRSTVHKSVTQKASEKHKMVTGKVCNLEPGKIYAIKDTIYTKGNPKSEVKYRSKEAKIEAKSKKPLNTEYLQT